ncbi:adenine DNA glycosylase-like isoform X2 [Oscarella lobularis]|uniref:adenine DNA glycosylase-like isoform X2 n=1 Tax=Oscarella lobularis TaxID=121494 RepID=UPI003313D8FC
MADASAICRSHSFESDEEIDGIRKRLLTWYEANKRDLPWRSRKAQSLNEKAYAVWVSEVMLQQTRVAAVIDKYKIWMKKFPAVEDLAKASLDEVQELWSGMGYYSRCKKLHEAAQKNTKVVNDLNGIIPTSCEELAKQLPGVGRYTAAAIASIAFNERVGIVDGNVIRVLSRLRRVGVAHNSKIAENHFWFCSNKLVDEECPGDFNQALMELGATVCTPKSPACSSCPVSSSCLALKQVHEQRKFASSKFSKTDNGSLPDIESSGCSLCLPPTEPWDSDKGVTNFPRRGKKTAVKTEEFISGVTSFRSNDIDYYLIVKRPSTGLLAGLWEFPTVPFLSSNGEKKIQLLGHLRKFLSEDELSEVEIRESKTVSHLFSHRRHIYHIHKIILSINHQTSQSLSKDLVHFKWVTEEELFRLAISAAVKKMFEASGDIVSPNVGSKTRKRKLNGTQQSLEKFFKK